MSRSYRRVTPIVALSFLIAACSPNAQATTIPTAAPTEASPAPTLEPTVLPTAEPTVAPTAQPAVAQNVAVAGVEIGELDFAAARAKLESELPKSVEPLTLVTGSVTETVGADQIGLAPDFDAILTQVQIAKAGDKLPLTITYDSEKLRAALESIAKESAGANGGIDVIRDTKAISASFVVRGGGQLDVDTALPKVEEHLKGADYAEPLTLELSTSAAAARPTKEQLQAELDVMAKAFDGVVGVYIHDLKTDSELASVNKGTAFSTASTIKAAILLNAYAHVETFSAKQIKAIEKMIIESDNLRANDVLAASVGGTATEQAFEGAELMSETLAELGMPTTYQYTPFEANDFIKLYKPKYKIGPKQAGEPPFTNSSRVQRTTPAEMAELYRLIEACSRGTGKLVEQFPDTLNANRCNEMIDLMKRNADTKRMVSGLPKGADVAHKSGWAQPEVQGDAGIVRTPGGDFVISIYVYQKGEKYKDPFVQQLIGNFTRLVYTYYNPIVTNAE